jgi:hypothetical protein
LIREIDYSELYAVRPLTAPGSVITIPLPNPTSRVFAFGECGGRTFVMYGINGDVMNISIVNPDTLVRFHGMSHSTDSNFFRFFFF